MDISERIDLHKKFWQDEEMKHIPVSFRLGDYFFADKYKAAKNLLTTGKKIDPNMLNVNDFIEDYERMYSEIDAIGQTGFWTAEPYIGIPWMEAILGCEVYSGERSFVTKEIGLDRALAFTEVDMENNIWFIKYIEFIEMLATISDNRFPVGQPITRQQFRFKTSKSASFQASLILYIMYQIRRKSFSKSYFLL